MPGASASLRPNRNLLLLATCAFLLLVILGPLMSHIPPDPLTGNGTASRQLGYITVLALAMLAVRPPGLGLTALPVSLLVTLAWCWLSITWAVDPGIALRRVLLTSMVMWTIFLTVAHLGYESTVGTVRAMFVFILIANVAAVIAWPSVGIHGDELTYDVGLAGDWRGLTQHKNFAGAICASTVLLFMLDARRLSSLVRWGVVSAAGYFLYRSGSKTSLGMLPIALCCGWAYQHYSPRYRVLLGSALSVAASVMLIVFFQGYWDSLEAQLTDPDALTGRGWIWPVMMDYIGDHWLLGSGYGSFWNIGLASPVFDYSSDWVSTLANGHNGYLDVLAQIGLPGLLLVIWAVFALPLARLWFTGQMSRTRGALITALIVFCAGHNLTESSLLDRDMFIQVVLMYAVALIAVAAPLAPVPSHEAATVSRGRA